MVFALIWASSSLSAHTVSRTWAGAISRTFRFSAFLRRMTSRPMCVLPRPVESASIAPPCSSIVCRSTETASC